MEAKGSSIEIYRSEDGGIELNVRLQGETVWLSRQQMAELFGRDYKTIAKHIANALREELEGVPVVAKICDTQGRQATQDNKATRQQMSKLRELMQTLRPNGVVYKMLPIVRFEAVPCLT